MRTQSPLRLARCFLAVAVSGIVISFASPALAKRAVPENLGNGHDKLVESHLAIKAGALGNFEGFATKQAATVGVGSVILQLKPMLSASQAIAQGVNQHRITNNTSGVGLAEAYKLDN